MASTTLRPDVAPEQDRRLPWQDAERSGDFVRLGLAVVIFVLSVLAVQRGHLSQLEEDVFRIINNLPDWLLRPLWLIEQLGSRLTPLILGALVIFGLRRVRLGISIMVAGTGAWLVAQILKTLVERARPADFLGDLPREWSSGGPGFVSGHTAVATAMAAVAAPYLPRRWRRVVWALAALVGFARIYTGVHLPLDVVGGFAVGWFVGTAVHMLIGTPRPRRTADEVTAMLTRLGLDVAKVEPANVYAEVSHPFRVTTRQGERLFAKVLDPDPRSSDWLLRFGRLLASGERRDISAMASLGVAADHEAAVTLAAQSAGVRVPHVHLARGDGDAAVVLLDDVPGTDLSAIPDVAITDELLRQLWKQVAILRHARIAHRDLVRANVLVDRIGHPWLLDFRDAEVGAADTELDGDVAELMASLAVAIGPARAVGIAREVLGHEAVERSVPELEAFALSARTRGELRHRPGLLDEVRAEAGGEPQGRGLVVTRRLLFPMAASLVGYAVLIAVAGWTDVSAAFGDVLLRWVTLAAVLMATSVLLLGYALRLAVRRRVAIGRSAAAVAVAGSAEDIGGPAARRSALESYLRSCGGRGDEPQKEVSLVMASEIAAAVLIFLGAVFVAWDRGDLGLDLGGSVLVYLGVAAVAAVAWMIGHLVRRTSVRTSMWDGTTGALRTARLERGRSVGVVSAVAGAELLLVLTLASAIHAWGGAPVAVVAMALAGTRAALGLLGLSGAPLVAEALCIALLIAFGVGEVLAVLAVLLYAFYRVWATAAVSALVGPRLTHSHHTGRHLAV